MRQMDVLSRLNILDMCQRVFSLLSMMCGNVMEEVAVVYIATFSAMSGF